MKNKKTVISIFLAVLLVFALLPAGALPAYAEEQQETTVPAGGENPADLQQNADGTAMDGAGNSAADGGTPQDVTEGKSEEKAAPDTETEAQQKDPAQEDTGKKRGGETSGPESEDEKSSDAEETNEAEPPAESLLKSAPAADSGIPVLTLTIDPDEFKKVWDSEDHSYRATGCSIKIDVPEGYTGDYFDNLDPETVGTELALDYFRGRGNSTWQQEKRPFKFKFDKKKSLLGMDKNKHWILMANYMDITQMRNRLTSYIATKLGLKYMAQYSPVEFYVNDKYMGCYMLCHDAENKVDGDEPGPGDISGSEVTGKYMLALEPYPYEHENDKFTTDKGINFLLKEPTFDPDDKDCGQPEQREYITGYLQDVEDALYGDDFKNADGVRYSELMDMKSAAIYWWVQTFASNNDGFTTPSTYLYKLRSDKLYWGPLWDFDMAYSPAMLSEGINQQNMAWLDHIRAYDPAYQKILRDTWDEFDSILDDMLKQGGIFDRYAAEVRAAEVRDYEKYNPGENGGENYDNAIASLRELLKGRQERINSIIDDELTKVYVTLTFKDGDKTVDTVKIKYMDFIPEDVIPDGPEKAGYIFRYWATGDGSRFKPFGTAEEDMVLQAVYVAEDEAVKPEALYFPVYEIWVDIGYETYDIPYSIAPEDTDYRNVSWKSSDPGVVSVDENGAMSLNSVGTATVTGTLYGGKTSSVILHVYDPSETETVPVESVLTESDTLKLRPGEYGQMKLTLKPMPVDFFLEFESSDEDVATVDPDTGMVHAISPGTCTIKIWESHSETYATYTVIVEEPGPEPEPEPEPEKVFYYYVSGGSLDWTRGSSESLKLVFKRSADDSAAISHFSGIDTDGKTTERSGYDVRSGSVIVELKPAYLETLKTGRHTLSARFDDADSVTVGFSILEAANNDGSETPKTGDDSGILLWTVIAVLAAVALAVAVLSSRRKKA